MVADVNVFMINCVQLIAYTYAFFQTFPVLIKTSPVLSLLHMDNVA